MQTQARVLSGAVCECFCAFALMRNRTRISRDEKEARECQQSPLKSDRAEDNTASLCVSCFHTFVSHPCSDRLYVHVCKNLSSETQTLPTYFTFPDGCMEPRGAVSIFKWRSGSGSTGQRVLLRGPVCSTFVPDNKVESLSRK